MSIDYPETDVVPDGLVKTCPVCGDKVFEPWSEFDPETADYRAKDDDLMLPPYALHWMVYHGGQFATEPAERTLWNGHFTVGFRHGRVRRFRWQHLASSAADAHRSLVAAARREYPDATRIRCHVLPAEEA